MCTEPPREGRLRRVLALCAIGMLAVGVAHRSDAASPSVARPPTTLGPSGPPVTGAPRGTMPPTWRRPMPVAGIGSGAPCPAGRSSVATWPTRRLVAQVVGVGIRSGELGGRGIRAAREGIGTILVTGVEPDAPALRRSIQAVRSAGGAVPPMFAVDEEGGRVQVLRSIVGRTISARRSARISLDEFEALRSEQAQKIRALGFDVVFAPVLDVTGSSDGVIVDRSLSGDPAVVADRGVIWARAVRASGLVPVLKHWPGHGGTDVDTHRLRATAPSLGELERTDLPPFDAVMASGPVAVMVGHLESPGLSGDLPASVSRQAITGELRGRRGFQGLVVTDSLSMAAVNLRWPEPLAAVRAVAAGADVALFATLPDWSLVLDELERALGDRRLNRTEVVRSAERVLRTKGIDPCTV